MAKKRPELDTMFRGLKNLMASAAGATRRRELGVIVEKCDAVFAKIKEIRKETTKLLAEGKCSQEKRDQIDQVLEELGFFVEDLQSSASDVSERAENLQEILKTVLESLGISTKADGFDPFDLMKEFDKRMHGSGLKPSPIVIPPVPTPLSPKKWVEGGDLRFGEKKWPENTITAQGEKPWGSISRPKP